MLFCFWTPYHVFIFFCCCYLGFQAMAIHSLYVLHGTHGSFLCIVLLPRGNRPDYIYQIHDIPPLAGPRAQYFSLQCIIPNMESSAGIQWAPINQYTVGLRYTMLHDTLQLLYVVLPFLFYFILFIIIYIKYVSQFIEVPNMQSY